MRKASAKSVVWRNEPAFDGTRLVRRTFCEEQKHVWADSKSAEAFIVFHYMKSE
jgi:hypothetical protein